MQPLHSFNHMFSRSFLVLASTSLFVSIASAQDTRIGAIDVDRVLRESNLSKSISAKLEQDFTKRQKELMSAAEQLRASQEKFERDAPTLAESQRTLRQSQLIQQDREYQKKSREYQEDLNAKKNDGLQQLMERVNRTLKQVAESEKYDLVVQEAAYISPRLDITDKVINALNAAKP